MQPADSDILVGAQGAVKLAAGVDPGELVGRAQPLERLGQPGAGDDPGPVEIGAGRRAVLADVRSGEHPHRLGEREAAFGREPLGLPEPAHHPLEPLTVDLDPLAADEGEPIRAREDLLHLGLGQLLAVERDLHAEVEERVRAERGWRLGSDRGGHLRSRRPTRAPVGRHADHDAGTLQLRDIAEEPERLLRRPAKRVEDLAGIDHLLEPGAALGGALDRKEEREELLLVGRTGVLAQCLTEREVLGLAVPGEAVRVGREEGERRLLVLAVLGEVEVDATDDVPGRVAVA